MKKKPALCAIKVMFICGCFLSGRRSAWWHRARDRTAREGRGQRAARVPWSQGRAGSRVPGWCPTAGHPSTSEEPQASSAQSSEPPAAPLDGGTARTWMQHTVVSPSQHSEARSKAKSPSCSFDVRRSSALRQVGARGSTTQHDPAWILRGHSSWGRGARCPTAWLHQLGVAEHSTAPHPAPAPARMRAAGAEARSTSAPPPAGLAASPCPRGQKQQQTDQWASPDQNLAILGRFCCYFKANQLPAFVSSVPLIYLPVL